MAIAVAQAAGDDRPLGVHTGQKLRMRGGEAAVVPHFEQCAGQPRLGQHRLLDGSLGVTLQHYGGCAVGYVQHYRVVVGGLLAGLIVAEGRQDVDLGWANEKASPARSERTRTWRLAASSSSAL